MNDHPYEGSRPSLAPNPGKELGRDVPWEGRTERWLRFPVRTGALTVDTPLLVSVVPYLVDVIRAAHSLHPKAFDPMGDGTPPGEWYVLVSEKVVAITQGRSFYAWDVQVTGWARFLSRFVLRTPHGIGLAHPAAMQLAINEAGLPRVLLAAAVSAIGKLLRQRGWFYKVAGHDIASIDGPTANSVPPSDRSVKLPPADPDRVARELSAATAALLGRTLPKTLTSFGGSVVLDASDLDVAVLGADTDRPADFFRRLMADNPLGQDRQMTPLAVAIRIR